MSIQEHLNKIRNAVYGHEVRESIAKGIETAYDDASENGNANMEVNIARGTHPNLRSRLDETTAQLQQTEQELNAQLAEKAKQVDLNQAFTEIDGIDQRIDNLVVPISADNANIEVTDSHVSVLKGKTFPSLPKRLEESEADVSTLYDSTSRMASVNNFKNRFDRLTVTNGYYIPYDTGVLTPLIGYSVSDYIKANPYERHTRTTPSHTVFLDVNDVYLGGTLLDTFETPANTAFMRITVQNTKLLTEQLELGSEKTPYQEYGGELINIRKGTITSELLAPKGDISLFYAGTTGEYINYDKENWKIKIPIGGVVFRNKYYSVTNLPLELDMVAGSTNNMLQGLFFNAKLAMDGITDATQLFNVASYANFPKGENWVLLSTFTRGGQVNMLGAYAVNGNYLGIASPESDESYSPPKEGRTTYTSAVNGILVEVTENETSIDRADFVGSNNPAFTLETGLYTVGKQFNRLRDSTFKYFKGLAGLRVGDTVGTHSTLTGSDLLFLSNKIGFFSQVRAEYIVIANSQFNKNEVAARIHGGNVQIANCMINDNVNGIELLAGGNDSHGIISDCQINHNTGYGLLIDGIVNGHTISGTHFYDSKIWIKNTTNRAVRFDNCVIAGALTIENCAKVIFNNCYFPSDYLTVAKLSIVNSIVVGSGNEIETPELESIFNTN